jgi:hypothetical protein
MMNSWKVLLLVCALSLTTPGFAQEQDASGEGQGFLKELMDTLGSAAKEGLEQGFDEWLGTYKGRLGQVTLVERRGNAVVLEVTYQDVKRSDGVFVEGEVLSGGEPLEGFSSTVTPVRGRHGKVRLTMKQTQQDSGWGSVETETESDQIQLFLVRETHPDRRFGHITYDLPKTWTQSDAPDEPPSDTEEAIASDTEEAIELAEEESLETSESTPPGPVVGSVQKPYVRPGTVLAPAQKSTAVPTKTATLPSKTAYATKAVALPAIQSYDFYDAANHAVWYSGAGKLPFPGKSNDRRGFVRLINRGTLHPDRNAVSLIETHPQWTSNGWIEGRYPVMVLDKGVRFRAVAGFLKGASASKGVIFKVLIKETARRHEAVLIHKKVLPGQRVRLRSADLTPWSGKKVQFVLRVEAGPGSAQDWAVWVKPRLIKVSG